MTFETVSAGDQTRPNGDVLGIPHDEASGGVKAPEEGMVVDIDDDGVIASADINASNGEVNAAGILQTYQYYEDADTGTTVDQSRDATVVTRGAVRARVESTVSAGDTLAVPDSSGTGTAGVLAPGTDDESYNFYALTDAAQDPDDSNYYAEVLVR